MTVTLLVHIDERYVDRLDQDHDGTPSGVAAAIAAELESSANYDVGGPMLRVMQVNVVDVDADYAESDSYNLPCDDCQRSFGPHYTGCTCARLPESMVSR